MTKSFIGNFLFDKIDSIIEKYEIMKNNRGIKSKKNISEKVSKSWFDVCTFNTGSVFKNDGLFHVTFDCTNGTILQFTDKPYDDVKYLYRQDLNLNKNKDLIHANDSIPNGVFYLDGSNEINIIKILVHGINQGKYHIICSPNYNDTSDTFLGIPKDNLDNLKDPILLGPGVFFLDSNSDIESNVRQIVAEQLGIFEEKITPNSNFIDDLGADSLDTVELIMAFEEEFEIEIPDEEAEKIQTVGDAVNYIESKVYRKYEIKF